MKKFIIRFVTFLIVLYASLCIFLYFKQSDLLFFPPVPNREIYTKLEMIPNIQHGSYKTRDGYVLDTWEQVQTGSTKTIFYFGGNAEDIAYFISQTQYSGANLIGYNYR